MRAILIGVCVLGLAAGCGGNPEVADNGGLGRTGTEGGAAGAGVVDQGPGIDVKLGDGGASDMPTSICATGSSSPVSYATTATLLTTTAALPIA